MLKPLLLPVAAGALLLGLPACTKIEKDLDECPGSCTVVRGRLTSSGGTEALSNVPLTVEWKRDQYYIRQKVHGRTERDGSFQLRFFVKDDELQQGYFKVKYSVKEADFYQLDGGDIGLARLKRDTTVNVGNYLVPRKALLELRITNPQDIGTGSYWSNFSSLYGTVSTIGPAGGGPAVNWQTPDARTGWVVPVPGDQPIVVSHLKTRNGVRTTSADTIFVPRGTRRPYNVTF